MSNETIRFADLGLSEATLRAVEAMGFAEPTLYKRRPSL